MIRQTNARGARRLCAALSALLCVAVPSGATHRSGQGKVRDAVAHGARTSDRERRTAAAMERARANPLTLHAFLERMPKGADLHLHLTGAVYAETFLDWAARDGLCIDPKTEAFARAAPQDVGVASGAPASCNAPMLPATEALNNEAVRKDLVDAFSMRDFVPREDESGHDHFFESFDKFRLAADRARTGDMLAEVAARAARQNEQYLEAMLSTAQTHGADLGSKLGWEPDLRTFRERLLAAGLREGVAEARAEIDRAEARMRDDLGCDASPAGEGCGLRVRYLYQVSRGAPPERVFAQALLGFEIAQADPRFVGINFVMPEDGYLAMRDYHLQMQMLDLLHGLYPGVHIALHAGELAPGLVPPAGLRFHIREAVELGHAERIGHGADVMYEDRPYDLLREMARRRILVEICQTSNDVILGVRGDRHPLPLYRTAGVPVSLNTDDEGVSRVDLTHEFERAAETFHLRYRDLKTMARASLAHDFLPGTGLWSDGTYARPVPPCEHDDLGADTLTAACTAFLKTSEKASEQRGLERRFELFEQQF